MDPSFLGAPGVPGQSPCLLQGCGSPEGPPGGLAGLSGHLKLRGHRGPRPGSRYEAAMLADPTGRSGLPSPSSQAAQSGERAHARAGPLQLAAPRMALLSPRWLMPPQGSALREVPTHMSHPPGSGPPLPLSLLVSSEPGMRAGPSVTHRTQRPDLGAPGPRETTQELVALYPALVLEGRGLSRGSGAS